MQATNPSILPFRMKKQEPPTHFATGKAYLVTYRVTGSIPLVSIIITNSAGSTERIDRVELPWEKSLKMEGPRALHLSVLGLEGSGTILSEILVNGKPVASNAADQEDELFWSLTHFVLIDREP